MKTLLLSCWSELSKRLSKLLLPLVTHRGGREVSIAEDTVHFKKQGPEAPELELT